VFVPAAEAKVLDKALACGQPNAKWGQVRPASYDDAKSVTRYTIEFVVGPFGDVEISHAQS
jgi:hypothetical protein